MLNKLTGTCCVLRELNNILLKFRQVNFRLWRRPKLDPPFFLLCLFRFSIFLLSFSLRFTLFSLCRADCFCVIESFRQFFRSFVHFRIHVVALFQNTCILKLWCAFLLLYLEFISVVYQNNNTSTQFSNCRLCSAKSTPRNPFTYSSVNTVRLSQTASTFIKDFNSRLKLYVFDQLVKIT